MTLVTWLSNPATWGTVPAWFGGLGFLLAVSLFLCDRRRNDREQIDKTAVWITAEWDSTLSVRDRNRVVEPTEEIKHRICAKNSNDVPVEIGHAAFLIETAWWVPEDELGATLHRGTEPSRLFQGGYLLAPGEQREQPQQGFYVGHQAPAGANGLGMPPDGVRCRVVWFLATDNAGRRWEVRPGQGKRARRLRWYSYGRTWYPSDWQNPIAYPVRVWAYSVRDRVKARWHSRRAATS